jgi:hypothetical protein
VIVSLTADQDRTYQHFLASRGDAGIAVVALGMVQWALPPGMTYLDLFSCRTPCVLFTAKNAIAAKQIVGALSDR